MSNTSSSNLGCSSSDFAQLFGYSTIVPEVADLSQLFNESYPIYYDYDFEGSITDGGFGNEFFSYNKKS
jgi:hypothetical protein